MSRAIPSVLIIGIILASAPGAALACGGATPAHCFCKVLLDLGPNRVQGGRVGVGSPGTQLWPSGAAFVIPDQCYSQQFGGQRCRDDGKTLWDTNGAGIRDQTKANAIAQGYCNKISVKVKCAVGTGGYFEVFPATPGHYFNLGLCHLGPYVYKSPVTYQAGMAIENTPSSGLDPAFSFSVSPALPPGLTLASTGGRISGVPTKPQPATEYLVTAQRNYQGEVSGFTTPVKIAVAPPIVIGGGVQRK